MYSRKAKTLFSFFILFLFCVSSLYAQVWVDGYYRDDGTYVKGHQRTSPDGNPYNNYSYPGNYNPNTGKITPGNSDTYLRNYYDELLDYNFDYDWSESNDDSYSTESWETPNNDYEINRNQYYQQKSALVREISIIQSGLQLTGYDPGPVDGLWGPKTQRAIVDLQIDNGIYESGEINQETISALVNELEKLSGSSNSNLLASNSWLKGTWTGTGYEINYDTSWEMRITFSQRGYFVKYSSPECTGEWILEDIETDKITFRENLSTGLTECANNGKVVLSKFSDNKISFKFYYQYSNDLAAHAFITKE